MHIYKKPPLKKAKNLVINGKKVKKLGKKIKASAMGIRINDLIEEIMSEPDIEIDDEIDDS